MSDWQRFCYGRDFRVKPLDTFCVAGIDTFATFLSRIVWIGWFSIILSRRRVVTGISLSVKTGVICHPFIGAVQGWYRRVLLHHPHGDQCTSSGASSIRPSQPFNHSFSFMVASFWHIGDHLIWVSPWFVRDIVLFFFLMIMVGFFVAMGKTWRGRNVSWRIYL